MRRAPVLTALCWAMGIACVAIGVFHFTLGIASVPGETHAGATVDSRERFYNAIFLGYGLVWIWTVRQQVVSASWVRMLSLVFLLGGAGRLLSIAVHGWPNWFQSVLTVVELLVPVVFWSLASADERRVGAPGE